MPNDRAPGRMPFRMVSYTANPYPPFDPDANLSKIRQFSSSLYGGTDLSGAILEGRCRYAHAPIGHRTIEGSELQGEYRQFQEYLKLGRWRRVKLGLIGNKSCVRGRNGSRMTQ